MKERVGNIRKIDKLGRVSIPAELRRLLNIDEETPLTVEYDSVLKEIRVIPLREN
jgi:AbrB family looped-hinge helix DNA binding protein